MTAHVVRQVVGYGFAVLANGAALLLWQTLTRHVGPGVPPFLTFYPAVMLAAALYGLGPGLLATVLAALLAAYFVFPPEGFAVESPVNLLGLGIFSVMGVGMSLVAERYHRAQDRATTYAQELAAAASRQRAEEALHTSLQRFYVVLANMYSEVLLVADDGRVEFANPAFCTRFNLAEAPADLVGLTSEVILGKIKQAYRHPEEAVARIREIVARNQPVKGEELAMQDGRTCLRDYVPLNVGGRSSGRLWLHFDISDRQRAEAALRDLNATLERRVTDRTAALRQLTGDLATAEQRERQRLGQLLHDGLQQYLVAARMRLELLDRAHPSALGREVDSLLSEALKASRALTAELSPPILHSGGFVPALRWLAQWMQETHHLTVTVNADERFTIPHDAAKVLLFQSVRELLFNIVKHADIPHAAVAVHAEGGRARIVVVDHGKGFAPERMPDTGGSGLGLPTIRQRLEYLGGTLDIAATPGQGSRVTLTVPLRPGA